MNNNFILGSGFDALTQEQLAISSLLRETEETLKLNAEIGLSAEHFAATTHRKAWGFLIERATMGLSIEPTTLANDCECELNELSGQISGLAQIADWSLNREADGSFAQNAHIVKSMAQARKYYQIATNAKTEVQSNESTVITQEAQVRFNPATVYYDSTTSRYLIELENHFRTYTKKNPVIQGVTRYYIYQGVDEKEARLTAREDISNVEIDHAVDWSGSIAGHKKGILKKNGLSLLVTSEANLINPEKGLYPTIQSIFNQAFENKDAKNVFALWLANGYKAVSHGKHQPAPMMTLAGEVNTGKSLLAWIAKIILGGRVANPRISWSGGLPWNDDLAGSELLLLDDSVGSNDMRKRIEFGARFKESIYASEVQIHRRNKTSMSLSPVWRVMVCCNCTPEALSILPPLDEDLIDKISLLKVSRISLPLDTSTPEGKAKLQGMIKSELPAFLYEILKMETPEHLADSRAGVIAWKDAELVSLLEGLDESNRFEELLIIAMNNQIFNLASGEEKEFSAEEIESRLRDLDSPVREQCRSILGRHTSVTGRLLGKLAKSSSEVVRKGSKPRNHQRWILRRPR